MFCEDGRVGHRSGLGFHHSGMKHGIHGCCYSNMIHGMHGCCGERKREYYKDMAFIILVGCLAVSWSTKISERKRKIELSEEYRGSLLNELDGVEEELKSLKNE